MGSTGVCCLWVRPYVYSSVPHDESLYLLCNRLRSITTVILQGRLRHLITHECWYAITQRNPQAGQKVVLLFWGTLTINVNILYSFTINVSLLHALGTGSCWSSLPLSTASCCLAIEIQEVILFGFWLLPSENHFQCLLFHRYKFSFSLPCDNVQIYSGDEIICCIMTR